MSPSEGGDRPPDIATARNASAEAIRVVAMTARPDWPMIEELVRTYVQTLKANALTPERAVSETKRLVIQATGDLRSELLSSAVTWALSEYYDAHSPRILER